MIAIEIADQRGEPAHDDPRMRQLAGAILHEAGFTAGSLSIALVDDPTIHELNGRYLGHDCPTDVLSFVLERDSERLEAEVIASYQTAARVAAEFGWTASDELLLYAVHGTLHAVGYDDTTDETRAAMRAAERRYLALAGLAVRDASASRVTESGC